MNIENPIVLDLLDTKSPATSSTNDMPVIETKPDATNEGAPPKESAAAPDEGKTQDESATSPEETSASDEPAKKPAKGVQKRLDELTREREEARRLAESERQEKLRLLALLESRDKKPIAETDADDQEPQKPVKDPANPEAYEAALDEYIEKRSSWTARRETKAILEEADRKQAEQKRTEWVQKTQQAFASRTEKAKEKYPDYTEVAESPDVSVSPDMATAIMFSEDGTDIAYFLGKNPDEAKRISNLAPPLQLVELGKISARLSAPVVPPKPVSAAPAPGKPIKASAEATKSPEEESMDEYATRRKKELAAERRPGVRH